MPSFTSPNDGDGLAKGTPGHVDIFVSEVLDSGSETATVQLLSDLTRAGVDRLQERWSTIPESERLFLVQLLAQDADTNAENNYDRALLVALDDALADTRLAAIEGLAELESLAFLDLLLERIGREEDDRIRAAQAAALGRFALLAELGELEDSERERVKTTLLKLYTTDPSPEVRRRALESVAYIAADDSIAKYIQQAFESGNHALRVSALYAMGRQSSADWLEILHDELESEEPDLRYEAVMAAGMIGSERSVLNVIDMLRDEDPEVRMAAITALGAIGGRTAMNTLRTLAQDDSPAIAEAAEAALDEAQLTSNPFRPII